MFVNILSLCTVNFQENARVQLHSGQGNFLGVDTEIDIEQPTMERWCQRKQLKLPYWELNSDNTVY
jgi:hypothetical protein